MKSQNTQSNSARIQRTAAALGELETDLKIEILEANPAQTVDFGAEGQVTVRIKNVGESNFSGLSTVNLYISTDDTIDRNASGDLLNDGLLTFSNQTFDLDAGESQVLTLNYDTLTSVIAPGAYNLIAEVTTPNHTDGRLKNNVFAEQVSTGQADSVLQWNAIALNAIQKSGVQGQGVGPTVGSRLMAITSAAVFDTVNAFSNQYESYAVDRVAPRNASQTAAIAGAAFMTLKTLLPNQRRFFRTQLNQTLNAIDDSPLNIKRGFNLGRSVAREMLALRSEDGSNDQTTIEFPMGDYVWRPDAPAFTVLGPKWGKVTPFGVPSVAEFSPDGLFGRPGTGDEARTQRYAQEIEEVRILGGKENTESTTVTRTADQTEQAVFWAYDRADTFRPYGHLNQITQEIALREGNTVEENARLFGLLNIALADSAIVAWDAKYRELQPRPDDVISGDGQEEPFAEIDGLDQTVADLGWRPLLEDLTPNSPPFPDYISGHSTFGGAFGGVLQELYGEDYEFSTVSQELLGSVRTFNGFSDAGFEDAISRLYGGVHVREASVDGFETGEKIGQFIATNLLKPISPLT